MRNVNFMSLSLVVVAACFCVAASIPIEAESDEGASPIFGVRLPAGYRDWQLIGVAHEAGDLNDLRAILGNEIAVQAYKNNTRPFPDGAIIARLAWKYVPSEQNNAAFGRAQSFVAGAATNVQISFKDSRRYSDTGGWGYGQFEGGKANRSEDLMRSCWGCHARGSRADDFVFTHYAP